MMPTISSSTAPTAQTPATSPVSVGVNKNMFLQLLVAQMRNQDPMNPTDGTQFVAQLAQFQQLEQSINMGQDISTIRQDLDQFVAQNGNGTVTQA